MRGTGKRIEDIRRLVAAGAAVGLAAALLAGIPASADTGRPTQGPSTPTSVAVSAAQVSAPPTVQEDPPDPVKAMWPTPTSVTVDLAQGAAPGGFHLSGVGIDPPTSVRFTMWDRAETEAIGVSGLVLEVARADGSFAAGQVSVKVDYENYQHVYGGGFGSRLGIVMLPTCVLSTPQLPECQTQAPVPSVNDEVKLQVLAPVVDIPVTPPEASAALPVVLAVTAGTSSSGGDFKATSLAPSYSWAAGGQSGDFTTSYPIAVPPAPGGLTPNVVLQYSSGSVDGRVATTNNQTSWVGEGWDLQFGYVEAHYRSCRDDGQTINDLCYDDMIDYTLVFDGRSSRLIRDDTSGWWHTEADDGLRVEQRQGSWSANEVHQGLHWVVYTQDGTAHWFGTDKESTQGVVVFGDDAGEQCHTSSLWSSYCDMGYRWNLRKVVDPRGNVIDYFWDDETQKYGRYNNSAAHRYDRHSRLTRIEYGANEKAGNGHTAQIEFQPGWRCLEDPCMGGTTNTWKWYDTPWDLYCAETSTSCPGIVTPAFYTWFRLYAIHTRARNTANTAWVPVDTWQLQHRFPGTGDGTPMTLWWHGVTRTGLVGNPAVPPVGNITSFENVKLANRVNIPGVETAMYKHRIAAIYTDTGGYTRVTYAPTECTPSTLPPEQNNTKRCFPVFWNNGAKPWNWFHKYVVASVVEKGQSTGDVDETWSYLYANSSNLTTSQVMWAWDDAPNTPDDRKSWTQWRGYLNLETIHGPLAGPNRTSTRYVYHRGLNGDRASRTGGSRSVTMADGGGGMVADERWLRGFTRVETAMNSGDGTVVAATRRVPVWALSAYRLYGFGKAYFVREGSVITTTLKRDGSWRTGQTDTTYDISLPGEDIQYGLPLATTNHGDLAVTGDETCTRTTYAQNVAAWMLNYPAEVVTDDCAGTPTRLAGSRTFYDTSATLGAPPDRGLATRRDTLTGAIGGTQTWPTTGTAAYDLHGRVTEARDGVGRSTRTEYVPTTGGPVTRVKATNAAGHVVHTDLEPVRGLPTKVTDANGKATTITHDPLGRVTAVWLPGRATTLTPNVEYAYQLRSSGGNVVTTKELGPNGNQIVSHQLFDARLRPRQTQTPTAIAGGRMVVDTVYNDRGLVAESSSLFNASAPDGTLLAFNHNAVPVQQKNVYDHLARPTADIRISTGAELWRTSSSYWGDQTYVDQPTGGTDTTTYFDVAGRTTKLSQHTTVDTSYAYDRLGRLTRVTDHAGNAWVNGYDLRSRRTTTTDPDAGTTTITYDNADQTSTTTNARGITLAYAHDGLGRRTGVFKDSVTTGTKLAEFVYDTLAKGQLASSTRWSGGQAYRTAVTGYDDGYRPLGTTVTIPATETGLAGTYTFGATYKVDGSPASQTFPALAGLPAETLTYGYVDVGLPKTLAGFDQYVSGTAYDWDGRLTTVLQGPTAISGRVRQTFGYNTARRLSASTVDIENSSSPGTYITKSMTEYGYTLAGDVNAVAGTTNGVRDQVECFRYDSLRRLTDAWTEATWSCATPQRAGADPYRLAWIYDVTGNRKQQTEYGATGNTISTYSYPTAGTAQPHTLRQVTRSGAGSGTDSYTYDPTGNTITRPGQTLAWNEEGHVASVTQGGQTTSYLYDASGNRLIARDATGKTLYLPGGTELRHTTATNSLACTRYYMYAGQVVAMRTTTTGQLTWLAADHHGTTTHAVNPAGLVVQHRRSLPFGGPRGTQPTGWPGDKGFVGGTQDPTGLTHLGAREYDPATGRFISLDPVVDYADPQQIHGYSYANGSPVTLSDPDGLEPGSWCNTSACAAQNAQTQTAHPMVVGPAPAPSGGGGGGRRGGDAGEDRGHAEPIVSPEQVYNSKLREIYNATRDDPTRGPGRDADDARQATIAWYAELCGAGDPAACEIWFELDPGALPECVPTAFSLCAVGAYIQGFISSWVGGRVGKGPKGPGATVPGSGARFVVNSAGDVFDMTRVTIPRGKYGYLLNSPEKSGIFRDSMGFTDPIDVDAAVRAHLIDNLGKASASEPMTKGGIKFRVRGPMTGPSGATWDVYSVWGIDPDGTIRLITVSPTKG